MADPDDKLWEVRSKGLNYLLIAHAAGLVACLTALKDDQASPQLKGVGTFVWLFGLGFMSAVLAMAVLVAARQGELAKERDMYPCESRLIFISSLASFLILPVAIIVAIYKFGGL